MLKQIPPVTRALLFINIGLYVVTQLLSASDISLTILLGSYYPESLNFKFWQPLTHMFMHGGTGHIFFNMFALFMFGSSVETHLGQKRFLILYFLAGIGAFLLFNAQSFLQVASYKAELSQLGIDPELIRERMHFTDLKGTFLNPMIPNLEIARELAYSYITPMVGASGAIYGILVAYGLMFPNSSLMLVFLPFPIKAKYFIPGIMILEIILGLMNYSWNPVAHFAHIGGAITGLLIMLYWRSQAKKRRY